MAMPNIVSAKETEIILENRKFKNSWTKTIDRQRETS
jgi:hypothetical protein